MSFLENCLCLLKKYGQENAALALEKQRENVENGKFSIVMVGEFSAGKSTFLNALMRKKFLPSFTDETTATVNFLHHISEAPENVKGIVHYKNGSIEELKELNSEIMDRVVTTKGRKEGNDVAATVDHVDLYLDSEFLQDGVMLVDSPGLNGIAERHREITEQQIKASHAGIYVFDAHQPGSQTDFDALHEMKGESDRIFLILNQIDAIHQSEGQSIEDVIRKLKQDYRKQFPEETSIPEIWPISAKAALVARDEDETEDLNHTHTLSPERRSELEEFSRVAEFEHRLWQYLTCGERSRDQLCIPVENAIRHLVKEREVQSTRIKLLSENSTAEELEKKQGVLREKIQQVESSRKNLSPELQKEVHSCLREQREELAIKTKQLYDRVAGKLDGKDSRDEIQSYAESLPKSIIRQLERITENADQELSEELLQIVGNKYEDEISDIEHEFEKLNPETGMNVGNTAIELPEQTLGIDMVTFDKKQQELKKQLEESEKLANEAQSNTSKARKLERERQNKESELKELIEARRFILDNTKIPQVNYVPEQKEVTRSRGGLLGAVVTLLVGEKKIVITQNVADDTERQEALRNRNERVEEYEKEIEEKRRELKDCERSELCSEVQSQIVDQQRRRQSRLEKEYLERSQEFKEELDRRDKKVCRELRESILAQLDDILYCFTKRVRGYLTDREKQYTKAVQSILNVKVDKRLDELSRELNELITLLHTEGERRTREMQQAKEAEQNINNLTDQGAELLTQLERSLNDHVEEVSLL